VRDKSVEAAATRPRRRGGGGHIARARISAFYRVCNFRLTSWWAVISYLYLLPSRRIPPRGRPTRRPASGRLAETYELGQDRRRSSSSPARGARKRCRGRRTQQAETPEQELIRGESAFARARWRQASGPGHAARTARRTIESRRRKEKEEKKRKRKEGFGVCPEPAHAVVRVSGPRARSG